MNVIICGAGQVGTHSAEVLTEDGHNVTVIDSDPARLAALENTLDVGTLLGNGANADVLIQAGAADPECALVAATSLDEINLLTAAVARGVGAGKVIARVHSSAYFENRGLDFNEHLGIDRLICPEYSTAQAIAGKLRNPAALVIENFAAGQIEVQEFPVTNDAEVVGKSLIELEMPPGLRLAAIRRGDLAFLPAATSRIEAGDHVILVGNSDVFASGRAMFHERRASGQKMVIMGGSTMGIWMARAMKDSEFTIRVFEENRERAEELADKLDWTEVIHGDPTEQSTFDDEHIADADAFIGMSNDDEHNILGCAWAKSAGAETSVAVVHEPRFIELLRRVGIDYAFSPRQVAVRQIQRSLTSVSLYKMTELAEGVVDVYRVNVGPRSSAIGQPLRKLKLTPDWMIAARTRDGDTIVPGADDVIDAGDNVVVIGKHGAEDRLKKMFDVR